MEQQRLKIIFVFIRVKVLDVFFCTSSYLVSGTFFYYMRIVPQFSNLRGNTGILGDTEKMVISKDCSMAEMITCNQKAYLLYQGCALGINPRV
jgi:hypothetical protein